MDVQIFRKCLHLKKNNNWLNFVGGTAIDAHFEVILKCLNFLRPYSWMLFKYLQNFYIFKRDNLLNFVGGAAISCYFEVTLKCKKGFLVIFMSADLSVADILSWLCGVHPIHVCVRVRVKYFFSKTTSARDVQFF